MSRYLHAKHINFTKREFSYMGEVKDKKSTYIRCPHSRVAPGIFRQGADSSEEGAKYDFQGTTNYRNIRKIAFHLPKGG